MTFKVKPLMGFAIFFALVALLNSFIFPGSPYKVYFWPFVLAMSIYAPWRVFYRPRYRAPAPQSDIIPLVIPLWATQSVHLLWYAMMLTAPEIGSMGSFEHFLVVVCVFIPLWTFAPYALVRMSRLGLVFHSILQSRSLFTRQRYEYQTLPSGDHIRLVRLRGFIFWRKFEILSYPLDTCPVFEAISYTWDEQKPTSSVVIDNRCLFITRNALQVLYDFTPVFGQRMIWIDSICINQGQDIDALAEKKVQIGRMSEIYRRALRVRVWLSESPVPQTPLPEYAHFMTQGRAAAIDKESGFQWVYIFDPTLSSRSLELLLSHNYWTRVWIVQEIAYGKEVILHLGSMGVTWKSVSRFAMALQSINDEDLGPITQLRRNPFYSIRLSREILRGIRQICLITSLRQELEKGYRKELLSLLALLGGTRAFDTRDHIYGVLSLVQEKDYSCYPSQTIMADYTLSTRTLYINLARSYFLRNVEVLDARILIYAGIGWPRKMDDLPSWVPDWTSVPETNSTGFTSSLFEWRGAVGARASEDTFTLKRHVLKISGCRIIDSISAQTRIIDHDDRSRQWFNEICDIVEGQLSHISTEELDVDGGYSRCYRRCPGRWRGAIFRLLTAEMMSYWGEVPDQTKVTTFVRPDDFPADGPAAGYANPRRCGRRLGYDILEAGYQKWLELRHHELDPIGSWKLDLDWCSKFITVCRQQTQGLRFAVTKTGRMCLVPPRAAIGDSIMLSDGLNPPYLIRPMIDGTCSEQGGQTDQYQLVGHCIALGLMGASGEYHRDRYADCGGCNPVGYDPQVCKKQDIEIH